MTRVKICGITNVHDALLAAGAGADFLGLVFYPPSPRCVTPERAAPIVETVRRSYPAVRFVGVFVDETLAALRQIAACCGLDYVQLHGAETPAATAALLDGGLQVIKAFRLREAASLAEIGRYRATAYLLDTYSPRMPGGTGCTVDWALAAQARAYGSIILAGGLTPDNVAEAIGVVRPWAVDVASGVEAAPGRKDPDKVQRFIAATRNARGKLTTRAPGHRTFER